LKKLNPKKSLRKIPKFYDNAGEQSTAIVCHSLFNTNAITDGILGAVSIPV